MRGSLRLPCFCSGCWDGCIPRAIQPMSTSRQASSRSGTGRRATGDDMFLHPSGKFDNSARAYRHIEVRPLAAAMGAEIRGVTIGRETDAQFAEIEDALFRHKMIFFREQRMG